MREYCSPYAPDEQQYCACGGELTWKDEILPVGSDRATGYIIQTCEKCGKESGERYWVGL